MKTSIILLSIIFLTCGFAGNAVAQESADNNEEVALITSDADPGTEEDNSFLYFVITVGVIGILAAIYIAAYKGIQAGEMLVITGKFDIVLMIMSFITTGIGAFYSMSEDPVTTNIVLFYVAGAVCGLASLLFTFINNTKLGCHLGQHFIAIMAKLIVISLAIMAIFAFFTRKFKNKDTGLVEKNKLMYFIMFAAGFLILGMLPKDSIRNTIKGAVHKIL